MTRDMGSIDCLFHEQGAVYVGDPRSGVVYRIWLAVEHDARA